MASPTGCFVGLDQATLDTIRAGAVARINGQVTSVSEPGVSYSKSLGMPVDDVLREVTYAEKAASGRPAIRTSRPNFGGCGLYGSGGNLRAAERGGYF